MKAFLEQAAEHFIRPGFSGTCFVFPNRRSMAFFRKYYAGGMVGAERPVIAPDMLTINDFLSKTGGGRQADRITLLITLYDCYRKLNPKAEGLDEFIFWGDVLLGDFDDIDKYLIDPHDIFTNVADLKAIQDDLSHLDRKQREAVERFISHFSPDRLKLTASIPGKTDVKGTFMQIWNILFPLYTDFRETLRARGLSYAGMAYRDACDRCSREGVRKVMEEVFPHNTSFAFIGLNSLSASEKSILSRMKDAALAEFCWDHCGSLVNDEGNKSSRFIRENMELLGSGVELDADENHIPEINVVSVPSAVGQVKLLPEILSRCGISTEVTPDEFAVVLPDENLLLPLLETVPDYISDINVTMGFPMGGSEFYALMSDIVKLQMHMRKKSDGYAFYHKYVWNIFASGIFRKITDEGEHEVMNAIKADARYYVPGKDFGETPLMKTVFRPVVLDTALSDSSSIEGICDYLLEVASAVASRMKSVPELSMQMDFARIYWQNVTLIKAKSLAVRPETFFRLFDSMVSRVSVPFNGEPLKGLQIMGPLETRSLDFRNVVIFSCNEGVFPGRSISSSFIPAELRKGFDLPTYDLQDSMWAYYFYRLISRAEKVWLVYDSRTEGLQRGEESRFIKQLRYDFELPVNFYLSKASLRAAELSGSIPKTEEHLEIIKGMVYSASTLERYISCPASFYYSRIEKLQKETEVSESLDAAMFGTVYHNTMYCLYHGNGMMERDEPFDKLASGAGKGMDRITREYLDGWSHREKDIRRKVFSFIKYELRTDEVLGRDLVAAQVVVRYVMNTISADLKMLEAGGADSFAIEGLEKKIDGNLFGYRFFGVIDRIDRLPGGQLRVIDYKTGGDSPSVLCIDSGKEEDMADKLFYGSSSDRYKFKAALQFHIYDRLLQGKGYGPDLLNCMYAAPRLAVETPEAYGFNQEFAGLMDERLKRTFDELSDPDVPFRRTGDVETCEHCDFKTICGR